jgi:hypothetical protein
MHDSRLNMAIAAGLMTAALGATAFSAEVGFNNQGPNIAVEPSPMTAPPVIAQPRYSPPPVAATAPRPYVRPEEDQGYPPKEPLSPDGAAADLLLSRPGGLVATAVGAAVLVVTLPFSLLSGTTNEAAQKLVGEPADYTFRRPLGEGIQDW